MRWDFPDGPRPQNPQLASTHQVARCGSIGFKAAHDFFRARCSETSPAGKLCCPSAARWTAATVEPSATAESD